MMHLVVDLKKELCLFEVIVTIVSYNLNDFKYINKKLFEILNYTI